MIRKILPLLLIIVSCQSHYVQKNSVVEKQEILTPAEKKLAHIVFNSNPQAVFSVELAQTSNEWAYGLMNRQNLPANQGMLFLFPAEEVRSFWMKNTYISLDIIFMNKEWQVVHIAYNSTPLSLSSMSSEKLAQHVLEINAGLAQKNGIEVGLQAYYFPLSKAGEIVMPSINP